MHRANGRINFTRKSHLPGGLSIVNAATVAYLRLIEREPEMTKTPADVPAT
jgi:hypothetical protein